MNLLYYNSTRATNKYTGNISEWQWTQGSDSQNSYAFTYDKLDRVTNSNRYVGGVSQNAFTEKNITYDRNGNITQLQRYGSNGTTLQDNFTYNYNGSTHNGNRLSSISGSVSATYSYDNNGNMTTDGRKNLQISYNVLNLQQRLMQGGTTMADYTYLSDGTKCGVVDNINNGYDYLGSLVYSRSGSTRTFESAVFGGGRIVYSSGAYSPYYYTTDHLGSTRVITNISGTVVERNDYYPFGGKHSNASYPQLTVNRQKFNGKELQTTGNTGFLDYGARMYDDVIGRWGVVDPMAEQRQLVSPYNFVQNNPLVRIDPNGMLDDWVENKEGKIYWDENAKSQANTKHGEKYLGKNLIIEEGASADVFGNVYENINGALISLYSPENKEGPIATMKGNTVSADGDKYATIAAGTMEGKKTIYKGTPAVLINDGGKVPTTKPNPNPKSKYFGQKYADEIFLHAGNKNYERLTTSKGNAISEGCQTGSNGNRTEYLEFMKKVPDNTKILIILRRNK